MGKLGIIIFLSLFLSACQVKPRPVDYGTDGCHYCRMTIVDRQHAAQLVTEKGKAYKFDSVECMLNYMKDGDEPIALYLVADYGNPGVLTDATTATYLISENIPSPMGANLSAFGSEDEAGAARDTRGGDLYRWEELLKHFESK